jgi:hypothetical protein
MLFISLFLFSLSSRLEIELRDQFQAEKLRNKNNLIRRVSKNFCLLKLLATGDVITAWRGLDIEFPALYGVVFCDVPAEMTCVQSIKDKVFQSKIPRKFIK